MRLPQYDTAVTVLLAAVLGSSALPFGGALPSAEIALEVAVFLLLALAAAAPLRSPPQRVALPAAAIAGLGLLGLLQSLRWPASWVEAVAPLQSRLYAQTASLLSAPPGPSLSLAPWDSRSAALLWAAAAAALLAAWLLAGRRESRRLLAGAVLAGALFEILYGAPRWMSGSSEIWGVQVAPVMGRLRGTFVNPNHLALYLEMALAVAFAGLLVAARRARRETSLEKRMLLLTLPGLVWLTLFAGLAFTRSRAGLVAALGATLVQGLLAAAARRQWRLLPAGAAVAAAGVAAVVWLGAREGLGRLRESTLYDVSWSGRLEAGSATLRLWSESPWLGTGLGTFRAAFPLVQPPQLAGFWEHAHNGYLELLATTGLVGALLAAAGAWALLRRLGAVLRREPRFEDQAAAIGALGAIGAVAVHELFDFGLSLPANAVTLAAICGAALAAASSPPQEAPGFTPGGAHALGVRDGHRARHHASAGQDLHR